MKRKDLIKDLRELSLPQLQKKLDQKKFALIKNKMEFSFGKNKIHSEINKTKTEIARISTILYEKINRVVDNPKEKNEK